MKASAAVSFWLRDYQPSDFQRLCEIDQLCFPPKIACAGKQLRRTVSEKNAFTIVAEVEAGEVAGFLIASRPSPPVGHIVTLDVRPEFRRMGLGEQLMRSAEEKLRSQGAEKVMLETPVFGYPAQNLYHKLGFCRLARLKQYYADGTDAWAMGKRLRGPTQN